MVGFEGCFTAIVTPFKGTGVRTEVDWEGFRWLLEKQSEGRVSGIVPCGTTGESPTTSHEEHNRLISISVEHFKGMVIAGTGSNCTWEAIEMTKHAEDAGASASLQVCPYYNKPNQEGLFRHFGAIAEATSLPIILYNIQGRTSREIAPETMARLAKEYSNIVGVKDASGSQQVQQNIRQACGEKFIILSGNDNETFWMMRNVGARGVISVASNVIPKRMAEFARIGLEGNWQAMEKENNALEEFFATLFIDTNPIMVKEALNLVGLPGGGFRYPLCETSEANRKKMREVLTRYGLLG